MSRRAVALSVALLALSVGTTAHANHLGTGNPDCVSHVPQAAPATAEVGFVKSHGFGGGAIGVLEFPSITGVTPATTATEGDVVGVITTLNYFGVLGGGTTTISSLTGASSTSIGAQQVNVLLFTGHFKAVPREFICESVLKPRTIIHHTYFEITLNGLLTPTSPGSPLASLGAPSVEPNVLAKNNEPQ